MTDKTNIDWHVSGYSFGHWMYIHKDEYDMQNGFRCYHKWRFKDGTLQEDVDETKLVCPKCNKTQTKDGHDPCIANLPGVKFACCGHGKQDPYVSYEDGTTYRGEEAEQEFKKLKKELT